MIILSIKPMKVLILKIIIIQPFSYKYILYFEHITSVKALFPLFRLGQRWYRFVLILSRLQVLGLMPWSPVTTFVWCGVRGCVVLEESHTQIFSASTLYQLSYNPNHLKALERSYFIINFLLWTCYLLTLFELSSFLCRLSYKFE